MANQHTTVQPDGAADFSGGVDSVRVPTIQNPKNPNGLARNMLAWLGNATVRDGGISPRPAYQLLSKIHDASGFFQGGFLYEPILGDPYLVVAISGNIYQVLCSAPFTVTNLTAQFPGTGMPATADEFFFEQAEEYLIIQAGDLATKPLFWNGAILRRSLGINNPAVAPGTPNVNEIPAAGSMVYYEQRLWYDQGKQWSAGDMVGGNSGAGTPGNRGAVLEVTENPLVVGGDGFSLPANAGNIRVLTFNAQINSALGQGQLIIGTRRQVFAMDVPVTRSDWIAADSSHQPKVVPIQIVNGPVGARCVTKVNGDIYYNSLEPAVRSLLASVRNWGQPGNPDISAQMKRLLQANDRALMRLSSGIEFDSRLLMCQLPKQTPQGVVYQALAVLDFIPMSSFASQMAPIWGGPWEGLQVLQLFTGDFGGVQRAFAVQVSVLDGSIQLWELTHNGLFDQNQTGEARITWYLESPSWVWEDQDVLKQLRSGEIEIDRLFGEAVIKVEYRPDADSCYHLWTEFKVCSARTADEFPGVSPSAYPPATLGQCYRSTLVLPEPPATCSPCSNHRPSNIGYQFQIRITVKGSLRIRRLIFYAETKERQLFDGLIC